MRQPPRPEPRPEMRPKPRPEPRALTDEDGEVRELTAEDMRQFKPIAEVHPEMVEAMAELRRKVGRPKSAEPKVHIGFRLAPDVVESIKASGPGYNARVEKVLRDAFVRQREIISKLEIMLKLKEMTKGPDYDARVELRDSIRAPRAAEIDDKTSKKAKGKRPKSDAA